MLTIGRCPIRHGTNGDQLNFPVVIALGSDDVFLKAWHVHGDSGAPLVVADVVDGTGRSVQAREMPKASKGVEATGSDRNLKGM